MRCKFCDAEIPVLPWWRRLTRRQRQACYPPTRSCLDGLRAKVDLPPVSDPEWMDIAMSLLSKGVLVDVV